MKHYHDLTKEEAFVLVNKGTEKPYTGEYDRFFEPGVYLCKRCDLPLFLSSSKFHSGCGWPSFDEELPEHVLRLPDADGERIEIVCNRCEGHLGHVFEGEQITPKNRRHCVNSISLRYVPAFSPEGYHYACFAGGCFWGVQHLFDACIGVVRTRVGYMGGTAINPTYEMVCSKTSGHFEAVELLFDPETTSYESLCRFFLKIHDPTQKDGQGPDIGSQYRSCIFYYTEDQRGEVEEILAQEAKQLGKIATEVRPASLFYPAEEYHQHYHLKTGSTPSCHR